MYRGRRVLAAGAIATLTGALFAASASGATTLWDQYNNVGPNLVESQNFEPAIDQFDDEAADDALVPADERWKVTVVRVDGHYNTGGPAPTVNVRFYRDSGGLPASQVSSAPGVVPVAGADTGDFVIRLPEAVTLRPGMTYWVSVQVNMSSAAGLWGWSGRTLQSGNPAVWRNPGDGYETGCTSFMPIAGCGVGVHPDLVFRLRGRAFPVST